MSGSADIPAVRGVLTAKQVALTAASIAREQHRSGAIPWFRGGQVDPWDHVECAMALLVGGEQAAAERAYDWLFSTQRTDGSWPLRIGADGIEDAGTDANMCAYIAVGVWHHWLVRRDPAFVERAWNSVRQALDLVCGMQLPFGGIAWARGSDGTTMSNALVAGSSSMHHAFTCGLALAELRDDPQPHWQAAARRLGTALREDEHIFEPKTRFSMDWYYPVLGGAIRGVEGRARIDERWDDFVVPGLGIRCVDDHPWVTGAETCELVISLDALGESERAARLLADMQHLRDADGSYWTGHVFSDGKRWPEERTTWTAAAVILSVDALSGTTGGAQIFCGSADRIAGLTPHAG